MEKKKLQNAVFLLSVSEKKEKTVPKIKNMFQNNSVLVHQNDNNIIPFLKKSESRPLIFGASVR